jgi:hypothetical protein
MTLSWAMWVILAIAAIGIVLVVLRVAKVPVPSWVHDIGWIVVVAAVAILALRFLAQLAGFV